MTDARLPERWLMDRRIVRLTDAERSSYFMAILWTVSNRTDGRIDEADLPLIPTFNRSAIPTLVDLGLWAPQGSGWLDTEFARIQTSRDDLEVLERARDADKRKHARQRAHKAGDHSMCTDGTCDSPGPSPGRVPGTAQARRGEAGRRGQEELPPHDSETGEVTGWTVAVPGEPKQVDDYCTACGQSGGRHTGSCKKAKEAA